MKKAIQNEGEKGQELLNNILSNIKEETSKNINSSKLLQEYSSNYDKALSKITNKIQNQLEQDPKIQAALRNGSMKQNDLDHFIQQWKEPHQQSFLKTLQNALNPVKTSDSPMTLLSS